MSCLLIHLQRKGIAIMLGQPASILFLAWNYKTQKCNCNIFSKDSIFLKQTVHMAKSFRSYNVRIILKYTAVYSFHMKLICMIAIGHYFYFIYHFCIRCTNQGSILYGTNKNLGLLIPNGWAYHCHGRWKYPICKLVTIKRVNRSR